MSIFGTGGFSARVGIPSNPDRRKLFLRNTVTAFPFPVAQAAALKCPESIWSRLKERWDELAKENPDATKVKARMTGETAFEIRDPLHFSIHGYVEQFCRFTGEKVLFGFYVIPHDDGDEFIDDEGGRFDPPDAADEQAMALFRANGAEVLGDDPLLTKNLPEENAFLEACWKSVPKVGEIRRGPREAGPNSKCPTCGKKMKKCRCG